MPALSEPFFGDLDAMVERRLVRLLTVYSPMYYFLDGPDQRGIVYESVRELEKQLNKGRSRRDLAVHVVIVPVHRDELIPALLEGRGDLAAANLTITPERLEQVDFSAPLMQDIREVVVSGPTAPMLETVDDLAGLELHLRHSSSYWNSMERLNQRYVADGLPPAKLVDVGGLVEDDDLLEMVQGGLLPATIVDEHKAEFWSQFFDEIVVRDDLAVRSGADIGWAFRKNSPQLKAVLDRFVRTHRKGTLFGNVVFRRYLESEKWMRREHDLGKHPRFLELAELFRKYAGQYELDWLYLVAQAYQESGLDQKKRSRRGAVGVMQVLPATAREMGISGIDKLEQNIHAGARYMRHIQDHYLDEPDLEPLQRYLLTLAAYNVGPSRLKSLRRRTEKAGLDPDRWFDNVEVLTARHVSQEPIRYVSNIAKYYIAYKLIAERMQLKGDVYRTASSGTP